jgi:hypothetical protein
VVSSTNKTDRHDITEILLKVALSTIKQTNNIHGCSVFHSASETITGDFLPQRIFRRFD